MRLIVTTYCPDTLRALAAETESEPLQERVALIERVQDEMSDALRRFENLRWYDGSPVIYRYDPEPMEFQIGLTDNVVRVRPYAVYRFECAIDQTALSRVRARYERLLDEARAETLRNNALANIYAFASEQGILYWHEPLSDLARASRFTDPEHTMRALWSLPCRKLNSPRLLLNGSDYISAWFVNEYTFPLSYITPNVDYGNHWAARQWVESEVIRVPNGPNCAARVIAFTGALTGYPSPTSAEAGVWYAIDDPRLRVIWLHDESGRLVIYSEILDRMTNITVQVRDEAEREKTIERLALRTDMLFSYERGLYKQLLNGGSWEIRRVLNALLAEDTTGKLLAAFKELERCKPRN